MQVCCQHCQTLCYLKHYNLCTFCCFPAVEGNLFDHKLGSFAYSLSFSPSARPDMTEILLKKKFNCKSSSQPSRKVRSFWSNGLSRNENKSLSLIKFNHAKEWRNGICSTCYAPSTCVSINLFRNDST